MHIFFTAGVPKEVARTYMGIGAVGHWPSRPDEALAWGVLGIEAAEAILWRDLLGLRPSEAAPLVKQGLSFEETVVSWRRAGIPFEEVGEWIGAGLSPEEAATQRAKGITLERAATLRALRER
jgi:hypothetical protein